MENTEQKWYMATTISGKEEQVIQSLRNRVVAEKIEQDFDLEDGFRVMMAPHLSPKELTKKLSNEQYKSKEKNLFPGYIFIKMNMTNEAWFLVRNTQYVTGLVGSFGERTKPTPVSNLEMRKMEKKLIQIKNDFNVGKIQTPFIKGKVIEVIGDHPTKGQVGSILENDDSRQVAVVELIMFERKTPVEIPYKNLQIKK